MGICALSADNIDPFPVIVPRGPGSSLLVSALPFSEAAEGFLNTSQLSQDPRYFTAARRGSDFIEAKFVDRTHGDWIESVTRTGKPSRGRRSLRGNARVTAAARASN